MCQAWGSLPKEAQKECGAQGAAMCARAMRTDVDGVLDVADDDVGELFEKLAHLIFFQRLRHVLV